MRSYFQSFHSLATHDVLRAFSPAFNRAVVVAGVVHRAGALPVAPLDVVPRDALRPVRFVLAAARHVHLDPAAVLAGGGRTYVRAVEAGSHSNLPCVDPFFLCK